MTRQHATGFRHLHHLTFLEAQAPRRRIGNDDDCAALGRAIFDDPVIFPAQRAHRSREPKVRQLR